MRIAWLTPWAAKSAIAQFSALVIAELRQIEGVGVDIWYPPAAGGRTFPDRGRQIDAYTLDALRGYDAVVYNIGNHQAYHGRIHEISRELPGTIVLHDVVLTHMFLEGLLRETPDSLARILETWYGPAGAREVTALRANPQAWLKAPGKVERFPMLQPALTGASQIITHSEYAAALVREHFIGDVHSLGLPALSRPDPAQPGPALTWLDERPLVLQAGAVNSNKCVPLLVEAFADHDLGAFFQLVIAGYVLPEDRAALERRIVDAGLAGTVHIVGSVDDETMQALRHRASVATVLRSPVTEASSAVLIDSMAHGLAPIALEIGHYQEHPTDIVQFLPNPPSSEALGQLLLEWAKDPSLPSERGLAAAAYAESQHSSEAYAKELLRVLPFRGAARRRRLLASGTAELVERNGFDLDSRLAAHLAEEATALFGRVPRRGRP
jgi:glycosyltransferase involved in cell wall biosynthesis